MENKKNAESTGRPIAPLYSNRLRLAFFDRLCDVRQPGLRRCETLPTRRVLDERVETDALWLG